MPSKTPINSPLSQAIAIQENAAQFGFDWPAIEPVFAKLIEEADELKQAIKQKDQQHIKAELGDLLFVVANIARHLKMDPYSALEQTNLKFNQRFDFVLNTLDITQHNHSHSLESMEQQWHQSKQYFP